MTVVSSNMIEENEAAIILEQVKIEFGDDQITRLFERYFARHKTFEFGRNRAVFFYPTFVVKLPITHDGIVDNDWEGSISGGGRYDVQLARTRMFYVGDFPVVLMERIDEATDVSIRQRLGYLPDWVNSVDGGQVGFNRKGDLLAFDYGLR
jgi:hypothetical protein